eukprot:scaffold228326_cov43-Tisochrysis_lutea.AAC.1
MESAKSPGPKGILLGMHRDGTQRHMRIVAAHVMIVRGLKEHLTHVTLEVCMTLLLRLTRSRLEAEEILDCHASSLS